MSEEYDLENQPFNPKINETFIAFIERQRRLTGTYPEEMEFECRRCGECCLWSYFHLDIKPEVMDGLYKVGAPHPHGHWIFMQNQLHFYLPSPETSSGQKMDTMHFSGSMPAEHVQFIRATGRLHGYWVLNAQGKIVVYMPVPCHQYDEIEGCLIYGRHPKICREYFCKRYPI